MQNLAMIYAFGDDGYKKDMDKAVVLIKAAANKGLAASQYSLGILYSQGEGVNRIWRSKKMVWQSSGTRA